MQTNALGLNAHAAQQYHAIHHDGPLVDWADPRLLKITRLRLLSDPGCPFWDVSYCHGIMRDSIGEFPVRVRLPFSQLQKGNINVQIIKHAKADKVFAKGLGIFDAISTLC